METRSLEKKPKKRRLRHEALLILRWQIYYITLRPVTLIMIDNEVWLSI